MQKNIILPNMITMLALLSGVYSMISTFNGKYSFAALAILFAAIFDGLDGKVARLVNGTSEFGVQLDSLADLVSFGVAPALLVFHWQLQPDYPVGIGVMAAFLFVACGALRLARFNVQTKKISNMFFVGLPIPGAAATVASSVLFVNRMGLTDNPYLSFIYIVMLLLLAFLMVSRVPYYSFKKFGILKTRPFNIIVVVVLYLGMTVVEPKIVIFGTMLLYIISGFVMIPFAKRLLLKEKLAENTADPL